MVPWNLSEQLLDMVEQDPRFTVLEPATIIVWLKLIRLMYRLTVQDGPDASTTPTWHEMSVCLRVTEEELETHRDALLARGLLRRGPRGFLGVPPEFGGMFVPPALPQDGQPFVPTIVRGGLG